MIQMGARLAKLVTVFAIALAGAVQAPSQAQAAETNFTFTGHGYGHGRGMSQYGAQGAALRGLNARQILDFYYPGTKEAQAGGQIRVQLSADTDGDTIVAHAPGLRLRWLNDNAVTALPTTAWWRLRAAGANTVVESSSNARTWSPWATRAGSAEFDANGPLTLRTPSGDRPYRGALRQVGGDTINVLGLETYLQGVVAKEMPASWKPAALQSQAVAARTYVTRLRQLNAGRSFDTCDTTSCQVYGGQSAEVAATNNAIAATNGQIRTYAGSPALTQYSSSSGGHTVYGGVPYLPAQPDPYDSFSGNPLHSWAKGVSAAEATKAFPGLGTIVQLTVVTRSGGGDWGGRAAKVKITGSKGTLMTTGSTVRSRLGLRSDWFTLVGLMSVDSLGAQVMSGYRSLGGRRVLGAPRGPVRAVGEGGYRVFAKGRVYWSPATGAVKLAGKGLHAYLRAGGPKGKLGFPTYASRRIRPVASLVFEHGQIMVRRGKVLISF